jgi:hypothetical protein
MDLQCIARVAHLSHLAANWDSYGAEPPNASSIQIARAIIKELSSIELEPTGIDPSVEGGVCISFREGRRYADLECFNNGCVLAVTSLGGADTKVWEIVIPEGVRDALHTVHSFLDP